MKKTLSLQFHDVYQVEPKESGFDGAAADSYKLNIDEFESQFAVLARSAADSPGLVTEDDSKNSEDNSAPLFITFDDGGVSYYTTIADRLESLGWRGHCLITTDYIGKSGFLNVQQIRELHQRGHCIGTHSVTHPTRFASCTWEQMVREWSDSKQILEDILGDDITVASLPGGFYSRQTALAAHESGLKVLFTSEPTTRVQRVGCCDVIGRFTVRPGSPAIYSSELASLRTSLLAQEWLTWNSKKVLKYILGSGYMLLSDRINQTRYRDYR